MFEDPKDNVESLLQVTVRIQKSAVGYNADSKQALYATVRIQVVAVGYSWDRTNTSFILSEIRMFYSLTNRY